jgi:uncharacterized protein
MFPRWLALPAFSLLLILGFGAHAEVAIPPLRSPVTDLTGTLTPEQSATLEQQLRAFEAKQGSQIAVLIVPTTQPETIQQYSFRVAEAWQLGRRGVNDGVLLAIAKDDRAVWIQVGYGLEGALPDVLANRIVEQVIRPRFRSGDFFGGIREAIERMIALIEGEPLPEPAQSQRGVPAGSALPLLLLLVFVGAGILRRMLGRFGGASVTAGLAAALVWLLTSTLVIAIGAAVIAFVIALLGGGGGGGWTNPRRRGWGGYTGGWGGGWGGGGGWSGGGGGWSGGGGTFGGGGAGGRW